MTFYDKREIDFTKEPLFFGQGNNVARVDIDVYPWIKKLLNKHNSQFWMEHDYSYTQDAKDYALLHVNRKEFFKKNLKFQTLLDSIATRSVLQLFLPLATSPQMESWLVTHGYFEDLHSRSYAELIKAMPIDSKLEFDDIIRNEHIQNRGKLIIDAFETLHKENAKSAVSKNNVITKKHKEALALGLYALNVLENVMFSTSFVCSYAFAENGVMESSAKMLAKINADEQLHYAMSIRLLKILSKDTKQGMVEAIEDVKSQAIQMYENAYKADIKWIDYVYESNPLFIGLTSQSLKAYSQWNASNAMMSIGLKNSFIHENVVKDNPLPWVKKYQTLHNVVTAMQETDGSSYGFGLIDLNMSDEDWNYKG